MPPSFPQPPSGAEPVTIRDARASDVPSYPVVVSIVGDGIGRDVFPAMQAVVNAAVLAAGQGRRIAWYTVPAGEDSQAQFGTPLPEETLRAIERFGVAIKGPLTTPVGGGYRSVNVTLRQALDLYACVRPVRHYRGVPSPVKEPDRLDVVIFRENTEDVYAGIEWPARSGEAERLRAFLVNEMGASIREGSALGIKPMSEFGSKRLVRAAIRYAIDHKRRNVTLVHKGNIMKHTEGAFRDWGYAVAREEFRAETVPEAELNPNATQPVNKIVIMDRIADSMFQQVLLRPEVYDVIALPNLNGDYLSDACAAQVGGLGMAPGANIGASAAVFEATHGSAPKYAGQDVANPCSLMLSARMMLEFLGWREAAASLEKAIEDTISSGIATQDLARLVPGSRAARTMEFAQEVVRRIEGRA